MKPVFFDEDLRFLVLDVNACDTDYTHWISPNTTERNVLELYSFLYMLNRIFYHAEKKCCFFVQQKERLVPGNLLVRKEIVAGHILYFGFERDVLDEFLPACLTLALMINGNHFDARRLFVSPLCLDILKTESWTFDGVKGVGKSTDVTSLKGMNASGVFGSYKTLNELARLLMTYHHVSHIQDANNENDDSIEEMGRYDRQRHEMSQLLVTEDETEFATGLVTLLSGTYLFRHSFRMARTYREMRDLIALNGQDLGLDDFQITQATSCEQKDFVSVIKEVTDAPVLPVKSPILLDCVRNAIRRYHWGSVFAPTPEEVSKCRLDLTGGIAWQVLAEHIQRPFSSPLYTMTFPRDRIDKGMQLLQEFIDQPSINRMDEMQRELEAYSMVMGRERLGDMTDVRQAALFRQGAVDKIALKNPLFADMRHLLKKLADVLQPGSKVRELYRGPFAQLTGKLVEDAVRNPNKPISKCLESLVSAHATLVDRHRNFHTLHLNSLKNEFTEQFILAVHNPFDATTEMSDGLLINDFVSYSLACHSKLLVETLELRLAVTSGVAIDDKNIWVGWQGPAGNGKSTCAKSVLHGISVSDGLCLHGMVREMDSTTTASMKSVNDDPFLHCGGVGFVNELNDGGNDKSGTLRDDSSEKSTLMKNFFDSGMSAVYRARVNESQNEVRQNVQHVIFDCVFIVLANHLSLCPSLRDRMVIHTINKTATTGDRMSLVDIFNRMDRFKVGHYEILKLLVIALVSMFEFVGCTLEDVDYLADMERLVLHVIDEELRAMHLDANFLGRGRLLDNIRSLVRMLAMHRAVLTVLGCIDTFRLPWQEHDPSIETLEEYNQRMMQLVVDDLQEMSLHTFVRRVQEVFCPSPADYIAVVTMECLDQNPYVPMFRAIARSVLDPAKLERSNDGRKVFVVQDMTYARLCDVLNNDRIPFESKEIRGILEAMTNSITRDGIPAVTITNQSKNRTRDGGHATSFFQLTFDAMMAAEVVIESDMMDLVSLLTNDVQDIITKVLRELPPNATHDPRLPGEMIAVDTGHYGINANRFFGFLSQVRPNRWTSRYAEQIVHNYTPNAKSAKVSIDFNHARLKLMRNWMLQCAEQSENVQREQGYIRVHQMDRCPVLVSTIVDVLVRDTFERIVSSGEQARTLLPFYKAGSTVYVHQALPILRLGVEEAIAEQLRRVCAPPDYPIEYWTFDARRNPALLKALETTRLQHIDEKYTTAADALVCEQDLDGASSGTWLHLSILSRLEDVLCTANIMSPEVPKQFASRCMRKDLTDRKTVLYFNKRGTGPAFDVIKVDEVRSAHGGHLPSVELPCENKHHTVTASLAMIEEGHAANLGLIKRERLTTFPPQHETRYLTRKYLASSGKLQEIEDHCASMHDNDFDARARLVHTKMEALTEEWMERVKTRYRPFRLRSPLSSVEEFMVQDGGQMRVQRRGVKRTREEIE